MSRAAFSFRHRAIEENGKTRLMLSGEVQYFRTDRRVWGKVLRLLKGAHCDTLSTYVPWSWHEAEEGSFDFTGRTHPCRDLVTFLDMAVQEGFKLVLKPGPYVFAELDNGGIPAWLVGRHPEAIAKGPDGRSPAHFLKFPFMTYLHPAYVAPAGRWLDAVWRVLEPVADRTVMWQVDNEINYGHSFFWYGPYSLDYNPFLVRNGLYQAWLRREFGTIARLNARYRTRHRDFSRVAPPTRFSPKPGEVCATMDWVAFKEWLMVENVRQFCDHLNGLGAPGPFCVNAPFTGWATSWKATKRQLRNPGYDVVIAHVDYPGGLTDSNMGEALGLIHYARGCDNVLEANLETQACTVSKIWGRHGASYDLTHKTLIGSGMNVINYYWFNDGINFEGSGHYMESHEYECPVDVRGEPRPHYHGIKRLNAFLRAHPSIAATEHRADVTVGYLHEWGRAAFSAARWDPGYDHKTTALVILLSACGVTFDMMDLRDEEPVRGRPRTLLVQSSKFMPRFAMAKLAAYVRGGGRLILSNYLPRLDENLAPCNTLARALKCGRIRDIPPKPGGLEPNRIWMTGKEFFVLDRLQALMPSGAARVIATCQGAPVGYEVRAGRGSAAVLGFKLEYLFTDIHRRVLGSLLGRKLDARWLTLTRSGGGTTLKTVANMLDDPVTAKVDGRSLRIPQKRAAFVLKENGRRTVFI